MSDQELKNISRDVRTIKNIQLVPIQMKGIGLILALAVPLSLFALSFFAYLLGAIERLFSW